MGMSDRSYAKKLLLMILSVILCFAPLSGCSQNTTGSGASAQTDTAEPEVSAQSDTAGPETPEPTDTVGTETSAGAENSLEDSGSDDPIQWADPVMEQLMRDYTGKPEGDILNSDLDFVQSIRMIGGVYLTINEKDKDGIDQSYIDISAELGDNQNTYTKYTIGGKEYPSQTIVYIENQIWMSNTQFIMLIKSIYSLHL